MRSRSLVYYLFVLPGVIGFFFFSTLPALMGVYYSMTDFDGVSSLNFVGLRNFINLFQDEDVYNAYAFTIKYALVCTILTNIISLAMALALNARIKFKTFLRGVFFMPNVLGTLIVGYIFGFIFSNVLPLVGQKLGVPFLQSNILMDFDKAWLGIVIVGVWQACAFNIILYLAGLQSIPKDLYEAATIDGAGKWQMFRNVTFPLLAPFFTINVVLATRGFLGVFDQIVALTQGGPGRVTNSVTYLIYSGGFTRGEYGFQSANAVVFTVLMIAIAFIQLKLLQKREVHQ
ncbi:carbohydrate ABC transporter permease [Paenibacillus sp. GCM10027626]|uniref:carbohydrate ABC transporter permease n=1 Tax=Paenibacillus sp. GCM10027626 TaxID=3273411 RepID=UPI00364409DE